MITAVVFDIGETLVDDTREWGAWAAWLGVPPHTLSALVGAVTAVGRDNADALRLIRPGLDVAAERAAREAAGCGEQISESDLYPDVRPTLSELRARGLWVGAAGNQTVRAGELLRNLNLPVDAVATSGDWSVAKPDPRFYSQVSTWAQRLPHQILYVGDHLDNDVLAAQAAGLRTALIRRGPWGYLWSDERETAARADWRINDLLELPDLLTPVL
ncbi:HAD family hydrolase [Actinocorallia sp. API 0066]|uniref:HAD family hydrolase n=1 Tax=Actinocorallia sp. API 0066 TaxID=2896846 RepID=UPI001E4B6D22|nr:HAD family hydrolase [Actinocorallia sp. API 0066]MCD0450798.1 HAD family hydrolase [Actinocorallia sp. API 0066]